MTGAFHETPQLLPMHDQIRHHDAGAVNVDIRCPHHAAKGGQSSVGINQAHQIHFDVIKKLVGFLTSANDSARLTPDEINADVCRIEGRMLGRQPSAIQPSRREIEAESSTNITRGLAARSNP